VKDKAKNLADRQGLTCLELEQKDQDHIEIAERAEAAKRLVERYSDALQRLADF
jgi:hypothetical protein